MVFQWERQTEIVNLAQNWTEYQETEANLRMN
jgi:hypothetical protein